jgi:hypothetical protein
MSAPDGSDNQGERLSPDCGDSPCGVRRACYAAVMGLKVNPHDGMRRD